MRVRLLLSLTLISSTAFADPPARAEKKAKLAVLIVFDQMRGDFIDKWQKHFVEGGIKRLQTEGAWFDNCHYPYAMTSTGPGHASMLSGCSGDKHGIVANKWYDRKTGAGVYCATSERYERLPPLPKVPEKPKLETEKKDDEETTKGYGAPTQMLAPTLGDVVKEATGGRGKVIGLSLKDRSAILPCGKKPDGCYWFSGGQFVTSTYYRDRLHPWVAKFNDEKSFDRWFGTEWKRSRPDLDYDAIVGADDAPGEGLGSGKDKGVRQGVMFPHPFKLSDKPDSDYYSAVANSPAGNDLVFDLAKLAIVEEKLGQRDVPDLLVLSFSSNDLVGHTWGPDSHEVFDITLRSDVLVRDLLAFLDDKVGRGEYVVGLTADHGICPLPEVSLSRGKPSGRVHPSIVLNEAEIHLQTKFGDTGDIADKKTRYIEAASEGGIYLNQRVIEARKLTVDAVAAELADHIAKFAEVQAAYTRGQIERAGPGAVLASVKKCYRADRCGDVVVILKPHYLLTTYRTGTSHGTPHAYDTHVPLLLFGPGVKGGRRNDRVTPQALAACLARAIGVAPPALAEAPAPDGIFK